MSLLTELKQEMPVLHTLIDGIDEAIGAPVESLIGIVGDMEEDILMPLESLIGIVGDFGEEVVDELDQMASPVYDQCQMQEVIDKIDELITALKSMNIIAEG